jgi:uncharacterized membrane protein
MGYGAIGGAASAAGGAALAATGDTGLGWTVFGTLLFLLGGITCVRLATRKMRATA